MYHSVAPIHLSLDLSDSVRYDLDHPIVLLFC